MESSVEQEIKIELRDMVREANIQTTLLQQEGKYWNTKKFYSIFFFNSFGWAYYNGVLIV